MTTYSEDAYADVTAAIAAERLRRQGPPAIATCPLCGDTPPVFVRTPEGLVCGTHR